jgi:hypothetical protein
LPHRRRHIEDTAPSALGAKVKVKSKSQDSLVLEVDPVPDPRVIAFVAGALKAMGPLAEKAVIPYVTNKDIWAAQEVCRILQEVGTRECIPVLTEVANGTNNFVNGTARDALRSVKARTKGST